ncbi:MAG: DUF4340 domain-containing protein, partial [Alphaproteobacteria bacterium]
PETAAAVTVAHGGDALSVERDGERWVVPAAHGYAADATAVRDLLTGLADLRWAAPRTALEERYPRLEVDEPGPGSAAKAVTVTAADGTVLADAIIGKRSRPITGDARGTYLRLSDDARAWLAKGTVEVSTKGIDWLASDLPSLARDELKVVVVEPAEGVGFTVGRTTAEEDMTLVDQLPSDRSADADQIRRLAGVFAGLRFEDVRPAGEVDWPDAVTTVTGTSFADETLELELATLDDDQRWVRFADIAEWVYRLPDFQADRLDQRLGDLVTEPEAS